MRAILQKYFWIWPALVSVVMALAWALLPDVLGVNGVYLKTDILIFVLLCAILFFVAYVRRTPHLLRPWLEIFSRKLAMVSLVVLLVYVIIGLLDSVHYQRPLPQSSASDKVHYSVEVYSLFDKLVTPMREQVEETYSAPFATHAHTRQAMEDASGRTYRDYPRLQYGGAHLADISQRNMDILQTMFKALGLAVLIWGLFAVLLTAQTARKARIGFAAQWIQIWRGQTRISWRVVFLTLFIVIALICASGLLSLNYHIFGTDKVGNDVFYLALKSIRTGLVIGTLTTLIMLPFAILLGIMAGYFRGRVDDIIQYFYTTLNSIPGILLIAAAILSIDVLITNHPDWFATVTERSDLRLLALCAILGITSWTGLCRMLRGETLKLREMDYIQAATAFGVRDFRIILRHILPNVMHIVLIIVVLDFSGLVLAEAVLSYVGVGVDPSTNSWGNMINNARLELAREPMVWWSLLAAFVMMFVLVLAANLFADAVRDAFDPRLKQINQATGAKSDG